MLFGATFFFLSWGPLTTIFAIPAELFPTRWRASGKYVRDVSVRAVRIWLIILWIDNIEEFFFVLFLLSFFSLWRIFFLSSFSFCFPCHLSLSLTHTHTLTTLTHLSFFFPLSLSHTPTPLSLSFPNLLSNSLLTGYGFCNAVGNVIGCVGIFVFLYAQQPPSGAKTYNFPCQGKSLDIAGEESTNFILFHIKTSFFLLTFNSANFFCFKFNSILWCI